MTPVNPLPTAMVQALDKRIALSAHLPNSQETS
jgi:hypothetical protein